MASLQRIPCVLLIVFISTLAAAQSAAKPSALSLALSAAPPSVAAQAAVQIIGSDGTRHEIRAGTNGWTCIARDPSVPMKDGISHHPACYDKYGLEWMEAYRAGKSPNPDHVGLSYMFEGGSAWSNIDPAASKLPSAQADYIHIGPHMMILNQMTADSSGLPLHETNPDTNKPFVMFGGTLYALIIVPVK